MIEKIRNLLIKYREMISYIFFGGLTTVVSFVSYFVLFELLHTHYLVAQIVSWILAVAFAFVTNKLFVFEDKDSSREGLIRQIAQFVSVRVASLGVETVLLILMVEVFKMNENLAKVVVSVVTVILNYFASKLLVFRKKKGNEN